MTDTDADADREHRVEQVIAGYIAAEDAGPPPDRDALLAAHPDLTDDLRAFFRERDRFDRLAAPLRAAVAPVPIGRLPETTIDVEATGDGSSTPDRDDTAAVAADGPSGVEREPRPGTRIGYFGDYELRQELGRGGMGIVYEARQISLNRFVALKMLRAGGLASDDDLRRFQNEAEAVATLDHPNIVPIVEVGTHAGQRYFTMKRITGPSLRDRLGAHLDSPMTAARLVATAAEAVHHAHLRGILHRDLKPSNILLDDHGRPYVTDFGLAKRVKGESELTRSGAILGTPAYMSPEQAAGRRAEVTTASDVYGLGAVLYALLTGGPPFGGDSVVDTLDHVRRDPPVAPTRRNPRVPRDLEVICLKCLEKDPSRRYASAQAMADDLHRYIAGEPIAARAVGPLERSGLWVRRHPMASALAATSVVALAALIAAGFFITYNGKLKRANRVIEQSRRQLQLAYSAEALARHQVEQSRATLQASLASEAVARRQAEVAEKTASEHRALAVTARDEARGALFLATGYLYLLRVNQAHAAWFANEPGRASDLLDECPPDQRGWEWHYLDRQRQSRLQERMIVGDGFNVRPPQHSGSIVAWSPDGRPLALPLSPAHRNPGEPAGVVDLESGQTTAYPGLDAWEVAAFPSRFTPDGRRVVLAGFRHVSIRDTNRGIELLRLDTPLPLDLPWALAISADARVIALSFLTDASVWVWDATRQWHQLVPKDGNQLQSFGLSADGRRLAIARVSGTSILDVDDGRKLVTVAAGFAAGSPMVFSPDGRRLALTASDRPATVCEVASGRELQKYQGASPGYKSMAFSPDGRRLAAGGADGLITLWNVSTGRQLLTLRGHSGEVISLSFSPDGSRIASFAGDGRAKVWDATEAQEFLTVAGVNDRFFAHAFAYSPDGRRIAMAELTGRIGVYDIRHGEFPILIPCSDDRQNLRDVAYSPDGGRLAAAGSGGTVWVWDLTKTSARLRYVVPGTVPPEGTLHFRSVRFSPDGSRIALDDWNDFVIVCDADSGRVLHRLKNGSGAPLVSTVPLAFSPDGRRLATSKAERITLWDVSSGAEVTRLQGQGLITCLAFSPDGGRLAASSSQRDGAVKVWDTASGAMVLKLQGQIASGGVKGIAYSPDGRRLASFGNDAKIKLWDTASGQEALSVRLEDVDAAYPDLAFSPDGRHLAFVAADGSVRILDGSESTPEQQAELQARRGLRWSAWKRREVQTSVAQHDWNAAKQHLDQLAAREPLDGVLVVNRAITAYHLGRWADALADFSRAEALPEAPAQTWLAESLLRWARGDEQGSRRVAGSLLERMGTTEDPRTAATVAWANVLVHQGGSADSARVRTLAQLAARSNPENVPAAMILGLALYRAGRYDEALKGLEPMVINSRSAPPGAPLILAMIHQRLGQPGEARHWLDKAAAQFREADSRTPPGTPRLSWDQRLEYQRLRGEAEALILWDPIFPDDPFTR